MIGNLTLSVDGNAVERAIDPRWPRPPLSRAEQVHAARLLIERGYGTAMVGKRLGVSGGTAAALVEAVNGR